MSSGKLVYLCFVFLTKRIERFKDCIPEDWGDGYENVVVGCTIENQAMADFRLSIFDELPIKHKNIICQPMLENINQCGTNFVKDGKLFKLNVRQLCSQARKVDIDT